MRERIATTDLIKGNGATERLKRVLDMFKRYTGRELDINVPVFLSEKATGNRNKANRLFNAQLWHGYRSH